MTEPSRWERFKTAITAPFRRRSKPAAEDKAEAPDEARAGVNLFGADSVIPYISRDPQWLATGGCDFLEDPVSAVEASIWVYAATRTLATAFASVPLAVHRKSTGQPIEENDERGQQLQALLNKPLPDNTRRQWAHAVVQNMSLTGECYHEKRRALIEGESELYEGRGLPVELWPFPKGAFTPNTRGGRRKRITSYTPTTAPSTRVNRRDMFRTLYVRPGDLTASLGPVEGAQREISIDAQASGWQDVSLSNRGVPDGVFKAKSPGGQPLRNNQLQEIEDRIRERWVGWWNAHDPMVLGSDLDWIDMAKTAVELELLKGREFTKTAVAIAWGIPTVLWDVAGQTFANYPMAREIFWTQTALPLVDMVVDDMNINVAPEFGEDYLVVADTRRVEAMFTVLSARWDIAAKPLAHGVPMEQVSDMLALGVKQYPGWELSRAGLEAIALAAASPNSGATADDD